MNQNEPSKKDITLRLAAIRRRRRFVFMRRVVLLSTVAILVVMLFNGSFAGLFDYLKDGVNNIRLAVDRGDGFPSELNVPDIIDAAPIGEGAVVVGEKDMVFISPTGKQTRRLGNSYANPLIESSDDRVLIYTRGASDFRIEGYYQSFINVELDEDIYLASLADNGGYVLATSDSQFRSSVNVYNSIGTELFNYKLADEIPTVMKFSANSRYLAVATVYSVDGVMMTNIYGFSISSRELIGYIAEIPGICLDLTFQTSDKLLAVFEDRAMVYSINEGELRDEYDFADRQLLRLAVSENGDNIALLLGEEQLPDSITLLTFNSALDAKGETIIPFAVDNMQYSGYNLFISSGSRLYSYDDAALPIEDEHNFYTENIITILNNGFCVGSEFIYSYR